MAVPTSSSDAAPDAAYPVTITRTARQAWLPPVLVAAVLVIQPLEWLLTGSDPATRHAHATSLHYWVLTAVPLYVILLCLNFLPTRVELTDTALVVRRPLRRRRVLEWRHIQAVLVDARGARRRVAVYRDDPDGHRVLLPMPFSSTLAGDPRFAEKFHLIGQTWLARRGEDWAPLPSPPSWAPVWASGPSR